MLDGCTRGYFGMSVSPSYLEATLVMASASRARSDFELLVNMSQMTVSQTSPTTDSPQHRQHWLGEQALNWSGVPVAHIRPTVFQENPVVHGSVVAKSIAEFGTLRLPFRDWPHLARRGARCGGGDRGNPVRPGALRWAGRRAHGTAHPSMTRRLADEYSSALGRPVTYVPVPSKTGAMSSASETCRIISPNTC